MELESKKIPSYKGSCLCGELQFEIKGEFDSFYLCHCLYCKKDTGSAHAANLFTTSSNLVWLSAQNNLTNYRLPTTRHAKSFCKICGSAMPHFEGELLAVPVGSLDEDISRAPNGRIFIKSKAKWEKLVDKVPAFDELPD